jgi:hypothetical protein
MHILGVPARQAIIADLVNRIRDALGGLARCRRVFQRLLPQRPTPERLRRGLLPPADAVREYRRATLRWCQVAEVGLRFGLCRRETAAYLDLRGAAGEIRIAATGHLTFGRG